MIREKNLKHFQLEKEITIRDSKIKELEEKKILKFRQSFGDVIHKLETIKKVVNHEYR